MSSVTDTSLVINGGWIIAVIILYMIVDYMMNQKDRENIQLYLERLSVVEGKVEALMRK